MSTEPRTLSAPQLREVRAAARRQASALSGGMMLFVGTLVVAAVMVLIVLLDYQFNQPIHRVIKLILGAGAGAGIVFMPWTGLFLIPIVFPYLPWIPPIPIPGINVLNLLVLGVFASWAIPRVLRREPIFRESFLGKAMIALMAVAALSVIRGVAIPTGYTYDGRMGATEVFRVCMTLLIYGVTLSMVRGERDRRVFAAAIALGFIAESVTTILYGRSGSGARAIGSIGQSNDLGTYLAVYSVLATSMLIGTRNGFVRLLLLASVALGCTGIIFSLCRAAMIGVVLGIGYVCLRSSRLLTMVLLVTLITSPLWAPDYLKDRVMGTEIQVEGTDEVELDAAAQVRIDTWRAIMELVQSHPLDGVGFAGLGYVLPEAGESLGMDVKDSSHNTYLSMLAGMGIVGLGLFCWLLWKCWALAIVGERAAGNAFDRQLCIGLGGATLVLALSSAFGDRFFNVVITGPFWILCGLVNDILLERRESRP